MTFIIYEQMKRIRICKRFAGNAIKYEQLSLKQATAGHCSLFC